MESQYSVGDIIRLRSNPGEQDRFMLVLAVSKKSKRLLVSLLSIKTESTEWVPRQIRANGVEGSKSGLPNDYVVPAVNPVQIQIEWIDSRVGCVSTELAKSFIKDLKENQ